MSYKGSMEGWDTEECTGHCGRCSECEQFNDMKGDQEYESYCYEQQDKSDE